MLHAPGTCHNKFHMVNLALFKATWIIFKIPLFNKPRTIRILYFYRARFIRAVSELQLLGFIRPSKRKTDHVQRLTWSHGWFTELNLASWLIYLVHRQHGFGWITASDVVSRSLIWHINRNTNSSLDAYFADKVENSHECKNRKFDIPLRTSQQQLKMRNNATIISSSFSQYNDFRRKNTLASLNGYTIANLVWLNRNMGWFGF